MRAANWPPSCNRIPLISSRPRAGASGIAAGDYQLLFWQPPPSAPVTDAGVHSRFTVPLASLLMVKVWPSVAVAVTTYSSNGVVLVAADRHALVVFGQSTIVFSYPCRVVGLRPS